MRASTTVLCFIAACLTLHAQVKAPGEFYEPTSGMTVHFPTEMRVRDPETAIIAGHLSVFGSMENEAKEHALAAECFRPLLLADLPRGPAQASAPAARLLFYEFTNSATCKAGFLHKEEEAVAGGIAQIAIELPGARALTKPLYFDFGKQKMHASVAALTGARSEPGTKPSLLLTDGMYYHGHIFGWLMWADVRTLFNEVVRTNVLLDDGKTYPLLPFSLDEHLQAPAGFGR